MTTQSTKLWLSFPTKLVTQPVIYEVGKKFPITTNIRQASVTEEIGIMSVEFNGAASDIAQAIQWLESMGIKVDPVEINTIEG
jgi:L-aspartate semialdehyde sulfurtransferase ferredoxin